MRGVSQPLACISFYKEGNKQKQRRRLFVLLKIAWHAPGGGGGVGGGRGGDSHMKQTGMLVVSLRGINFGFWSRLGCSEQSVNILSCQGLV